jgi:maleate isomerase
MPRIGLLVPSSNSSVEPEIYGLLPPEVSLHTARLHLTHISPETIVAMVDEIEAQGRLLASADVDVIMLGAVAPGLIKGAGYDRELAAKIEAATGKRAATTATATLDALRHLGAKRIAIGAPYDGSVSKIAQEFMEANGITVVGAHDLGIVDNLKVGRLDESVAYDLGRKVDRPDADAIVFAGTNMRTMAVVERLEQDLGKPVVSTTAACLWAALRIIDFRHAITGHGKLLRELAA